MSYELWDIGVGKGLARYQSETEMAGLVRILMNHHGNEYATELSLSVEDAKGDQVQSLDGEAFIASVDEIIDHSVAHNGETPRVSLARAGVPDRGAA